MVIDPVNPDILYAAMYQRLRRTWGFNGGGPGSGIYKTTDGGRTWNELEGGIPSGDKGRIGLAISESNPQVVMALIEHPDSEQQGTYRSENGGLVWEEVRPAIVTGLDPARLRRVNRHLRSDDPDRHRLAHLRKLLLQLDQHEGIEEISQFKHDVLRSRAVGGRTGR